MNYSFWWDGKPHARDDILIGTIFRDPWMKPLLGQQIYIKGKLVRVTRTLPHPITDDVTIKYFVELVSGNEPFKDKQVKRKDML